MTSFIKQKTATFSRPRIIVKYMDTLLTSKPLTTATPVDGYTIVDGDIVLFTNLSAINYTIHRATVTGVNITWTQLALGQSADGLPALGDEVFIQAGTYTKKIYWYDGVSFIEFKSGGGIGDSSIFGYLNSQDDNITTQPFTTGNNATFLTAGTFIGSFNQKNETNPLNGKSSYTYTQGATSINDWIASYAITVPLKAKGVTNVTKLSYMYDGGDSDILPVVYDVTNSKILSSSTKYLENTNGVTKRCELVYDVPSTCSSIKIGFHVKVTNNGKILKFDDIETGVWTPQAVNLVEQESIVFNGAAAGAVSALVNFLSINSSLSRFSNVLSYVNDGVNGTKIIIKKSSYITINVGLLSNGASAYFPSIYKNGSLLIYGSQSTNLNYASINSVTIAANSGDYFQVYNQQAGNVAGYGIFSITASAISENVVQSTESKEEVVTISQAQNAMTDITGDLRYALSTASVTVNSISKTAASSYSSKFLRIEDDGTRTKFIANQETILSVSFYGVANASSNDFIIYKNGTDVLTRSEPYGNAYLGVSTEVHLLSGEYVSFYAEALMSGAYISRANIKASSPSTPTLLALPNGTETNYSITATGNAAQVITANVTDIPFIATTQNNLVWSGSSFTSPTDSIYQVSASINLSANTGNAFEYYINGSRVGRLYTQATGVSSIFPFSTTIAVPANSTFSIRPTVTATLSNTADHRLQITRVNGKIDKTFVGNVAKNQVVTIEGRTSSSQTIGTGATTLTLNTLVGDTSIASVSSNQITLQAGEYDVQWNIPVFSTSAGLGASGWNYNYLYNVTDASEVRRGDPAYGSTAVSFMQSNKMGNAKLTLTAAKVFELRSISTQSAGFYVGSGGSSPNDLASWVKITKLNGQ